MARGQRPPPAAVGQPAWLALLDINSKGAPKSSFSNLQVALSNDSDCQTAIRFNKFRGRTMIHAPLPWEKLNGIHPAPQVPRDWSDVDTTRAAMWLEGYGMHPTPAQVDRVVEEVAQHHAYHPVVDYLDRLEWDETPRIDTWLHDYLHVKQTEYVKEVGSKWLVSAVARVYEPGCQVDSVLLLEGDQGIGKSSTFRILGGPWYSSGIAVIGSKEAKENILGLWIIEIDELDAMHRASQISAVNSFITTTFDHFRLPFAKRSEDHRRQCVFGGSTNKTNWHHDETGGRRWWPVRCGDDPVSVKGLTDVRDQLWAEARDRYDREKCWHLTDPDVIATQVEEVFERREGDAWYERLVGIIHGTVKDSKFDGSYTAADIDVTFSYTDDDKITPEFKGYTINSIFDALKVPTEHRDRMRQTRIGMELQANGWKKYRRTIDKVRTRIYVPPVDV